LRNEGLCINTVKWLTTKSNKNNIASCIRQSWTSKMLDMKTH
jgi:hypothetical protein